MGGRERFPKELALQDVVGSLEASRALGWDVAHNVVDVSAEENWGELLREVIRHVLGSIDALQFDEVAFNPFVEGEDSGVDPSGTWCWFLGIIHGCSSVVVLVGDRGRSLRNSEVPKYAADEENSFTTFACFVVFRLSR